MLISCGMLVMAALAGAITLTRPTRDTANPATTTPLVTDNDLRAAKITGTSETGQCWQQVFDNQTGRMTKSSEPCDDTAYDSNGVPIPVGTIHRLDAISKSFSGQK